MRPAQALIGSGAALLLLALSFPSVARSDEPAPPPTSAAPRASLIDELHAEVARFHEVGTFEGAALVAQGDEVLLAEAVGFSDRNHGAMNTPDTVFAAGSLSKQFTAAAILKLAQGGKLRLDDPLSRHLPEYPAHHLTRGGVPVTLDHLLHHTAALPDPDLSVDLMRARWHRPVSIADRINAAAIHPLRATPGQRFRYSNFGYDLLGEVARRASGSGLNDYLRNELLHPMGMFHTGFAVDSDDERRLARGSFRLLGRRLDAATLFNLTATPLSEAHASGGLRTTVGDLHRWTRLYQGRGPLAAPWVETMLKPGLEDYGCGVSSIDLEGVRGHWHNGALSPLGFTSELAYFPARQLTVAVLANVDLLEGNAAARLRTNLTRIALEKKATRSPSNGAAMGVQSALNGAFLFVTLGPLRRGFLLLLLLLQGARMLGRQKSRLSGAQHLIDAWSVGAAVLVLADLSSPVRWAGLVALTACAARCYQTARALPWMDRTRAHHAVMLAFVGVVLALVAWLLSGRLLPPFVLLAASLLAVELHARKTRSTPATAPHG